MKRFSLQRSLALYVLGVIALIGIIVVAEVYYVQPQDAKDRASFISTIGSFVGGGALLIGLFFTWQQLQITLDGQITDRITKAVEQIGSENLSVRLGGLYALERIALDSDRDVLKIIDIICAFIRINSPSEFSARGIFSTSYERELSEEEFGIISQTIFNPPRPPEEIQTALQILSNLSPQHQRLSIDRQKQKINLLASNISGVKLSSGSGLTNLVLDKSNSDFVLMPNVNLTHLRASQSNFRGAFLEGANLKNSNLSESFFECAVLTQATLEGCHFNGARLDKATLVKVKAKGVVFNQARLVDAEIWNADLRNANLGFAEMQGASFKNADLTNATLEVSKLREADFEGAILKGARFNKANLLGAKNLTKGQLSQALLCKTTLPDGTISNRDCERMGIPIENSSTEEESETYPET